MDFKLWMNDRKDCRLNVSPICHSDDRLTCHLTDYYTDTLE